MKKSILRRGLGLALASVMLLGLLSGCGKDKKEPVSALPEDLPATEIVTESGETVTVDAPVAADSYDTIYQAFAGVQQMANEIYELSEQAAIPEEQLVNAEAELFGDPDYSRASVPVDGVTEGDLIITDGQYIYMVCGNELVIVSAAGAETKEVGRVFVTNPAPEGYSGNETPQAVYLNGSNLYVVTYEYLFKTVESEQGMTYESSEKVHVKQYDVSDKTAPKICADFAQSGRYLGSYVVGEVLTLIGAHSIWAPEEDKPETFVPVLTRNGEDALMEPGQIYICPGLDSTDYTVLSTINLASGEPVASKALSGYNAWSETDGSSLYLARTSYNYTMSDAYEEEQYSVTDFTYNAYTQLLKLSMDGSLELQANGVVEGYLFNQAAMSVSGGEVYLGTVCNGYAYKIYTDEKYGFVNYLMGDRKATNAVYALNSDLSLRTALEDVADGQSVYAIRFTGSDAYVMSFDSLIPQFTIDMSAAELKSEAVKGVDAVAHNLFWFGEGQTAGVGVSRAASGEISGLQLSVYDSEMASLGTVAVSEQWDTAMNQPAAIRVFPTEQVLAVPVGTGYAVYGFAGGSLNALGNVEMGYISPATRIFLLGEYWYFCNDATVVAVNAGGLTQVAKCDFAYG